MTTESSRIVESSSSPRSALLTFLIADVRGYTRFTMAHGDEAAARLAGTFAHIAKEVAAASDGEVIELRGDEALAVTSLWMRERCVHMMTQRQTLREAGGRKRSDRLFGNAGYKRKMALT